MRRQFTMCAVVVAGMLAGSVESARSEERRPPPLPAPAARPLLSPASPSEPEVECATIQILIVELRGDVERAFKAAGVEKTSAGIRLGTVDSNAAEPEEPPLSGHLRLLRQHAFVDVLSRPTIRVPLGSPASVQVSSGAGEFPYLVRTGEKTFEMKTVTASLGIEISLITQAAHGESDRIEISALKVSTTTLDGREATPGVQLDIGKPIISKRTLETSITLTSGGEPVGVLLPGPSGRQPLLFLNGTRTKPRLSPIPKY